MVSGTETMEHLTAILTYKIDGIEYNKQDMFTVYSREYEGEVYIFYNPKNPNEFFLPQKNLFKFLFMSVFMIAMGVGCLFIGYKILAR